MQPHLEREKLVNRPPRRSRAKKQGYLNVLVLFIAMTVGLFFINLIVENFGFEEQPVKLGATFSKPYAESLGLDWRATYLATLDDLGARLLRVPVYWNELEPEPGVYNFANVDWQLKEAAKRGAHVILAVGRKLPRWPECHVPPWSENLDESLVQTRILTMVETVVRRYADDPTVIAWQVENEPFFEFGLCPKPNREFLESEVAVVRALDKRPVVITESGEISTWLNAASIADVLGISTYRVVWSKFIGYFYWPSTPRYYVQRVSAVRSIVTKVIVSELQAEPWFKGPPASLQISEQLRLMNPTRLKDNIAFTRRIGVSEVYVWGVEWWYWLKLKGYPEMWATGKALFHGQVP
jgi:hypothetical protein